MKTLPRTKNCFVCGAQNQSGLRLVFETDGEIARTIFIPRLEHSGFIRVVHGGIISTVLDEVMVWAIAIKTKQFAYCAELTVRFHKPINVGDRIIATGRLTENKRNRLLITAGELRDEQGDLYASSAGKYIPLPPEEGAKMISDFDMNPLELDKILSSTT